MASPPCNHPCPANTGPSCAPPRRATVSPGLFWRNSGKVQLRNPERVISNVFGSWNLSCCMLMLGKQHFGARNFHFACWLQQFGLFAAFGRQNRPFRMLFAIRFGAAEASIWYANKDSIWHLGDFSLCSICGVYLQHSGAGILDWIVSIGSNFEIPSGNLTSL